MIADCTFGGVANTRRPKRSALWKKFDLHKDDDLSLSCIQSKLEVYLSACFQFRVLTVTTVIPSLQCCKYLVEFGVPVLPQSASDDRSTICLAAVMGYYEVLLTLLQSIPAEEIPLSSPCFR
jgi:hypothetical protein